MNQISVNLENRCSFDWGEKKLKHQEKGGGYEGMKNEKKERNQECQEKNSICTEAFKGAYACPKC